MNRSLRILLSTVAVAGATTAIASCGSEGVQLASSDPNYKGAEIFANHCAGCHTLSVAGTQGSAYNVRTREYKDGPNFDQRKENISGRPLRHPQRRLLVGPDAAGHRDRVERACASRTSSPSTRATRPRRRPRPRWLIPRRSARGDVPGWKLGAARIRRESARISEDSGGVQTRPGASTTGTNSWNQSSRGGRARPEGDPQRPRAGPGGARAAARRVRGAPRPRARARRALARARDRGGRPARARATRARRRSGRRRSPARTPRRRSPRCSSSPRS